MHYSILKRYVLLFMWIPISRSEPIDDRSRFIPSFLIYIRRYFDRHNLPKPKRQSILPIEVSFEEIEKEIKCLTSTKPVYSIIPFPNKPNPPLPLSKKQRIKRLYQWYSFLYQSEKDAYYKYIPIPTSKKYHIIRSKKRIWIYYSLFILLLFIKLYISFSYKLLLLILLCILFIIFIYTL